MIPPELVERLPTNGGWGVFVTVVIMIWGGVKTLSKLDTDKLENSFGWIGTGLSRIIHWFRDRERRQIEHEQELAQVRAKSFQSQIQDVRDLMASDRKWYDKQLDAERKRSQVEIRRLEQRLDEEAEERRLTQSWMEYAMQWGTDVWAMASEHGWKPPFRRLLSFTEWKNATCPDETQARITGI